MSIIFEETFFDYNNYFQALAVRYYELRKPLGLVFDKNELKLEKNQKHFVAIMDSQVVSTCSVIVDNKTAKIRQVATLSAYQGLGIGSKLNAYSENKLKNLGIETLTLHARKVALNFYIKQNYTIEGEEFMEVGIPHYKMAKKL